MNFDVAPYSVGVLAYNQLSIYPPNQQSTYNQPYLYHCCRTGNIMTISYIAGTTAGTVFAYVLEKIIHYEMVFPSGFGGGEYHSVEGLEYGKYKTNNSYFHPTFDVANLTWASSTKTSSDSYFISTIAPSHINATTTVFPG